MGEEKMRKKVKCSVCGFERRIKRKTYKIMRSWTCIVCGKVNKK